MKRDTVVGLIGAAILLVALVGVFRYESAGPTGVTYALEAPRALPGFEGVASPGQPYSAVVPVAEPNLTRLEFALDASGGTFNLTVQDPTGQVRAAEGAGSLRVAFPLAALPENGTAPGAPAGQGNWTVTVTLVQAPQGGPVPATVPVVGQGSGVAFKVTPFATTFRAA